MANQVKDSWLKCMGLRRALFNNGFVTMSVVTEGNLDNLSGISLPGVCLAGGAAVCYGLFCVINKGVSAFLSHEEVNPNKGSHRSNIRQIGNNRYVSGL